MMLAKFSSAQFKRADKSTIKFAGSDFVNSVLLFTYGKSHGINWDISGSNMVSMRQCQDLSRLFLVTDASDDLSHMQRYVT